ncbi:DUF1932 domain-containing protein [Microbacterium sp. P04]|uniref:DUF1932 domain-containing protein n=1 Tax=Microbacterium sp. P04 TaxID=3366947 RepID=UPI00374762C3
MTRLAVIGLGEAGRIYARGFRDAGAEVRGYDLRPRPQAGVEESASPQDAVAGAEVVVSLVGAASAEQVAEDVLPFLAASALYADFNTASPELKARVAERAAGFGIEVADVAVLAPVPRAGIATPLLASGPGAARLAAALGPLGAPVEVIDGEAGAAARLKLLRSVFTKGLATLAIETLGAGRAAGAEEWVRAQMASELGPEGPALLERFVAGTYLHAERREHEVRDVLDALESSGQPADMTRGTLAWFERIRTDGLGPDQLLR